MNLYIYDVFQTDIHEQNDLSHTHIHVFWAEVSTPSNNVMSKQGNLAFWLFQNRRYVWFN